MQTFAQPLLKIASTGHRVSERVVVATGTMHCTLLTMVRLASLARTQLSCPEVVLPYERVLLSVVVVSQFTIFTRNPPTQLTHTPPKPATPSPLLVQRGIASVGLQQLVSHTYYLTSVWRKKRGIYLIPLPPHIGPVKGIPKGKVYKCVYKHTSDRKGDPSLKIPTNNRADNKDVLLKRFLFVILRRRSFFWLGLVLWWYCWLEWVTPSFSPYSSSREASTFFKDTKELY